VRSSDSTTSSTISPTRGMDRTAAAPARAAVALTAMVVLIGLGCAPAPPGAQAPGAQAPGAQEPSADVPDGVGPTDDFEPPARPEQIPDLAPPGECDAETAAAIAATVSAQLDALRRDDIDAAYALTSPFFQRLLALEAFEAMIRDDYAYLLESSGHRLDECWSRSRRGYVLAGVRTGSREIVLRYDVSDEPDVGWRIDGAAELPGIRLAPDRLI